MKHNQPPPTRKLSIRTRVMGSTALIVLLSSFITGIALERAIRLSVVAASEARLQEQIVWIISAAEVNPDTESLSLPEVFPRIERNKSHYRLYVLVLNAQGNTISHSPGALEINLPQARVAEPGQKRFGERVNSDGMHYLVMTFGTRWQINKDEQDPAKQVFEHYTFVLFEDATEVDAEVAKFRITLMFLFGITMLLLLAALLLVLRLSLKPLREVADELDRIDLGGQRDILGSYPKELSVLTNNLNALLAHERARQQRLEHSLGDLAHSLKTPLAVMQGELNRYHDSGVAQEHLERMAQIIDYHLKRAGTRNAPNVMMAAKVSVKTTTDRLLASLGKVFHDKVVSVTSQIDSQICFRGVEGDLMEMLGNLLENAFKWCQHSVHVEASVEQKTLILNIEDDGLRLPDQSFATLLERGMRADERTPGYGLGLAIVHEMSYTYGGELAITTSHLGGVRATLRLPEFGELKTGSVSPHQPT
jgi:two-component system sensor histidine kinase PhoQ